VKLIGKNIGVENYTPYEPVYGIIANPPCTQFSFARTNAKKPRDLQESMRCVKHCLRIIWHCQYRLYRDTQKKSPLKFWVLENPDAMLRWFLGKPAMIYNSFNFGENYQKKA
jgi:site-specific DNA-cytosine methylase